MFKVEELIPTDKKFSTSEEEITFLREKLKEKEVELSSRQETTTPHEIAGKLIETYSQINKTDVIHPDASLNTKQTEQIILDLTPEEHDPEISHLYALMKKRGLKNTLEIVQKIGKPHIIDDFHRFLVQYLEFEQELPGIKDKESIKKSLEMKLFQLELPPVEEKEGANKSRVALMEQFFSGMQAIYVGDPELTYSIEMAIPVDGQYLSFYVAIPEQKQSLLEKLVTGLYPEGKLTYIPDDYNIFVIDGFYSTSVGKLKEHEAMPLKTYDKFDNDPLLTIISSFSKLKLSGEGAAFQVVLGPQNDDRYKSFQQIKQKMQDGKKFKDAVNDVEDTSFYKMVKDTLKVSFESEDPEKAKEKEKIHTDTEMEAITDKLTSNIIPINIRITTSAQTQDRTDEIMHGIVSSFNVFERPGSNKLVFDLAKDKDKLTLAREYSFRIYNKKNTLNLGIHELATLCHFPSTIQYSSSLKQSKSISAPAPIDQDPTGVLLGTNKHQGTDTDVYFGKEDRMRHLYVVGQTGTGKSVLLTWLASQDIARGDGFCFIDPHGDAVQTVLSCIPPERIDDVIYFDPANTVRPMALNMFEYNLERPEQMSLIIDELQGIFDQLFDMKAQGGAQFQQYFKNASMLVMGHPESGNTLLEVTRVLTNDDFRAMKLSHCKNPIIQEFWKNATTRTGEQSLGNFVPYITSKFDPLISNEFLRPVIVQEKSSFNMTDVMDNKKILLINLSKGRLGSLNSSLLGLIIVGKIQMAALARSESYGKKFNDFYLYIDEFQNVTTPSISSILSEARKYRLSLNVAHQFIKQLSDEIKNAVMGNVGSMAVFRVDPEDAKELEPRFQPIVHAQDIIGSDNFNCYMSMLHNGSPVKPFNLYTKNFPKGNPDIVDSLKELSSLKFGRPREEIEQEIRERYLL